MVERKFAPNLRRRNSQEYFEALKDTESRSEKWQPVDTLVVLGKNWRSQKKRKNLNQRFPERRKSQDLSVDAKIAAIAAGMMYLARFTHKIVFTGGKTAGEAWPSEAQAMKEFMQKTFQPNDGDKKQSLIPNKAIYVLETSKDTSENAIEIKQLLKKPEFSSTKTESPIGYMTIGYHQPRAEQQFQNSDLPSGQWFNSEEIISFRSSLHHQLTEKLQGSPRINLLEGSREFIARALLKIDPNAKIGRYLAHLIRGDK